MTFNGRNLLFAALGCGLVFIPAARLTAQQAADPSNPPAAAQTQAAPASSQDQELDPRKRERSDKEKFAGRS